jgi:hypothetical protein
LPSSPAPSPSATCLLSSSISLCSRSSHSDASLCASSSAGGSDPPANIRGGEDVQHRLAAPRVGKEVPGFEPVLSLPGLLLHLRPQNLLLGLPFGVLPEDMLPCLSPVRTPPALSGKPTPRPLQVLAGEAVAHLQLVEPRSEPLGTTGYSSVWPLLTRQLVFLVGDPGLQPSGGLRPTSSRRSPA